MKHFEWKLLALAPFVLHQFSFYTHFLSHTNSYSIKMRSHCVSQHKRRIQIVLGEYFFHLLQAHEQNISCKIYSVLNEAKHDFLSVLSEVLLFYMMYGCSTAFLPALHTQLIALLCSATHFPRSCSKPLLITNLIAAHPKLIDLWGSISG